jgi:hypothetical protein
MSSVVKQRPKKKSNAAIAPAVDASESFSQETPVAEILANRKPSVDLLAGQICLRWHRSMSGIIEACRLAAHADATLKAKEKKVLMGRLGIKKSYFSKLVKIGRDKRLQRKKVLQSLKPNVTQMYAMTRWADEDIVDYVKSERPLASNASKSPGQNSTKLVRDYMPSNPVARAIHRAIEFGAITADQVRAVDAILNDMERKYPIYVLSCSDESAVFNARYTLIEDFPRCPAPLDQI